jgi:hypothetical protein
MKKSNIRRDKPAPKKPVLGTIIIDSFYCVEDQRMHFTDGVRDFSVVLGEKTGSK